MNRRTFIALATAAVTALIPATLSADPVMYSDGLVNTALDQGKVVFLDYKATWCGTCKAQGRVIDALLDENPAYEANVTFVIVDWDTYKNAPIRMMNNIPRRSTLIVLKGDEELGRIVAGTGRNEIKALMDQALAAAG